MTFNRTVLEQVAKDGTTYKSLAKEMANFILGNLPQEAPKEFEECYLCMVDEGYAIDEDVAEAGQCEGIPILAYTPTGRAKSGFRIYKVRVINPEEQP